MSLNILIVEDDRPLAVTLMKGLENAFSGNVEVDICFSGLQAYSFINQTNYDLILSDYQMPGISGLELLHRIRQYQQKAFLILMTAYGTDELENKAKQFVDTYLTKPFDLPLLTELVKKLLGESIAQQESLNSQKILILEDDAHMRKLLQKVLSSYGYAITEADTLHKASEWLERETFDIFICDNKVPDGRGLDLLKQKQDLIAVRGTRVLMLTGHAQSRFVETDLPIDLFLEKPISVMDLAQLITRLGTHKPIGVL